MSALVEKLVSKSTQKNTETCRSHPSKCLGQVCFDGIVIVAIYSLLTYVTNKDWLSMDAILTFLSLWVPMQFLLKGLDLEYSDQLARVAGWTIGNKLFAILTVM
jgi:hypothetical protein